MTLQLRPVLGGDPAIVEIGGIAFPDCVDATLRQLADESRSRGDRRLLVDAQGAVGGLALYEHRRLGELAARQFGHLEALACVLSPGQFTEAGAQTAQERGANVQVFTSRGEALAWLRLAPGQAGPG